MKVFSRLFLRVLKIDAIILPQRWHVAKGAEVYLIKYNFVTLRKCHVLPNGTLIANSFLTKLAQSM